MRIGYNPTTNPNHDSIQSLDSWKIGAMDYAIQNKIDIINASIDVGNPSSTLDAKINAFTSNGRNGKGGIMLAATGNDGSASYMGYPARHANVMAVGASDWSDSRANFSNYGGYVEFLAPGVLVPSTSYTGGYGEYSGTSIASPVASGCAALILAANPNLTRIQLRDAMDFSCDKTGPDFYYPSGPEGRLVEYGYGRINVNNYFLSFRGIQGPSLFCGSQSQYTVPNLPSGLTVAWNSNNAALPISASGLVTNPSGQPGRTILTATISNACVEPRQKIIVAGSYIPETYAVSASPSNIMAKQWANGNNSAYKLRVKNNNPYYPDVISFGYAPSVGLSTLNPPNLSTFYADDQGWKDSNNGVTAIQVISAPSTWITYPSGNSLLVNTTGNASGTIEVKLTLPCGSVNVKFYIDGF